MFPQDPQLFGSLVTSRQTPEQAANGEGQAQAPLAQTFNPVQTFPQVPQLFESLCRLSQAFPQRLSPVPQVQALFVQEPPAPHELPHVPQLFVSVARFTHAGAHTVNPVLQETAEQAPDWQVDVPLATVHKFPQVPQLLLSVSTFVVQPGDLGSQAPKPKAQLTAHFPAPQEAEKTLGRFEQLFPHVPQFCVSVCVSSQIPLHSSPDCAQTCVSPLC